MTGPLGAVRQLPRDSWKIGAYWTGGYLAVTGILTVLVPNTLFIRMTPIIWFDYVLWPLSALMIGAFMALRHHIRTTGAACGTTAGMGGVAAFLGFSCPVCNKILLLLLGTGGVLTFVEPYRSWIGIAGVMLLGVSLGVMWQAFRRSGGTNAHTGRGDPPSTPNGSGVTSERID